MAGDWIPMRTDLLDDPAVIHMASTLGIDEYGVAGRLLKLWSWANAQLADGIAPGVTTTWIDRFVSTPGFAAALIESGWLQIRSGGVLFPKFDRWNSQSAKRRLMQTRAQQHRRTPSDGVASPTPDAELTPSDGVKMATRGEERRVKKKPKTVSSSSQPGEVRPRDPLFDAIAEASGLDPHTAGGRIGKVRAALASANPPYTADDVRAFARDFWRHCPYAADRGRERPTPNEIETNIGLVRAAPPPAQASPERAPNGPQNRTGPPAAAARGFRVDAAPGDFDACAPSVVSDAPGLAPAVPAPRS